MQKEGAKIYGSDSMLTFRISEVWLHYIQSKEEAYVVLKYLEDMIHEKAVC